MSTAIKSASAVKLGLAAPLGSTITSFGLGLSLFLVISGKTSFWEPGGTELLPSGSYGLALGLLVTALGVALSRRVGESKLINPLGFGLVCLVLFSTDWLCRGYSILQGPTIRGEILALSLISVVLVTARKFDVLRVAAILAPLLFLWCFLQGSHGRLLLSDDHAATFYRLWLLNENFPIIPHYYPLWNSGVEARDYFPSGMFNLFFLWFPLIKLFDLRDIYNLIVGSTIFVVSPLNVFVASRVLGFKKPVGEIAALLSSASSLLWFRWALKYGSMGFVTAMVFLPLTFALCLKIFSKDEELSPLEAVLFVFSTTLSVIWSLGSIIFAPVYIFGIFAFLRILRKRYLKAVMIGLLCCNLPWIITFSVVSNVGKFVQLENYHEAHTRNEGLDLESLQRDLNDPWSGKMEVLAMKGVQREVGLRSALHTLREAMHSTNPLIIIFALPGILLLKRPLHKLLFGSTALWLVFLGGFVSAVKPQLELDRMFVALSFLLCVPVAHAISSLFDQNRTGLQVVTSSVILGLLFSGIFAVTAVAQNRSFEHYYFADGNFHRMSDAISKYGGDGRTVFLGFILHELSHAHIAPLTLFTGKPIVASGPFHQVWQYSEVVPQIYIDRGDSGIENFLEIKNATAVVAHEEKWITYLDQRPEKYEPVWRNGKFHMYRIREVKSNYFLEGQGEILSQSSRDVKLKLSTAHALLKFQYYPFLKVPGCKLAERKLDGDISLIEISECPTNTEITILMQNMLERLLG